MTQRFASHLAREFDDFLAFKRALGFRYHGAESLLGTFDRFVAKRPSARRVPIKELVSEFLARNDDRKPITVALECSALRQFCLYRRRYDPTAFVPPARWTRYPTASRFRPHVLSATAIRGLLRRTTKLQRPFRAQLYRMLLLILYCTGLRFGEALRLRLGDVDLEARVLFVAETKGRSRWVPFHRSLAVELNRYLADRRAYAPAKPDDRLFVGPDRTRLLIGTASKTVRKLFRAAGLKPVAGRVGPRPYDFRHTFAVHRLERWYRSGIDVNARLAWLSAYMGHDDVLGTETYLTATPRLLDVAARRLKHRLLTHRRWP